MKKILITVFLFSFLLQNEAFTQTKTLTNKEYREFTTWVRDSLALSLLAEIDEDYLILTDDDGNFLSKPLINWEKEVNWEGQVEMDLLEGLYLPIHERVDRRKEIDSRRLYFLYYNESKEKTVEIAVHPDTLSWLTGKEPFDSIYHFGTIYDALSSTYFWHPYFDDYPVVGLNEDQLKAYKYWYENKKHKNVVINFQFAEDKSKIDLDGLSVDHWKITPGKYGDFMNWVADSVSLLALSEVSAEFLILMDQYGNDYIPPLLNWGKRKDLKRRRTYKNDDFVKALEGLYNPETKKHNKAKLLYTFHSLNLNKAANYDEHNQKRNNYIYVYETMVFPGIEAEHFRKDTTIWVDLDQDVSINKLTYEHAYTYYQWLTKKNAGVNFKKVNPASKYFIPTRDQWQNKLQQGEKVVLPESVELPSQFIMIKKENK